MLNLQGKRLLFLDGSALGACAVRRAKELGIYTIVANYYKTENTPGKMVCDEPIEIDFSNVDAMCELVREKKIDGIFVGWTDSNLPYYAQICKRMGLPCCGTEEQFEIFSNDKRKFKETCYAYGVPVPRRYELTMEFRREDLDRIDYPVLVKPADESGSRGIKRCDNEAELIENFTWLYNYSRSKKIFVEKYIDSPSEVFIYYTVQNGEPSYSAAFFKHKAKTEDAIASSAILHMFVDEKSAHYMEGYRREVEPAIIRLVKEHGLQNCLVMFQGFLKDGKFYFYESGLRMGGEQFYVFSKPLNGISSLDMMIEFAVTGAMTCGDVKTQDNPVFSKSCCNYYVTLKSGTITSIEGLEQVTAMPQVLQISTFKKIGDLIPEGNSLDRVIYRMHVMDETPEALAKTLETISNTLQILDAEGRQMQVERLTYERALDMTTNRYLEG